MSDAVDDSLYFYVNDIFFQDGKLRFVSAIFNYVRSRNITYVTSLVKIQFRSSKGPDEQTYIYIIEC